MNNIFNTSEIVLYRTSDDLVRLASHSASEAEKIINDNQQQVTLSFTLQEFSKSLKKSFRMKKQKECLLSEEVYSLPLTSHDKAPGAHSSDANILDTRDYDSISIFSGDTDILDSPSETVTTAHQLETDDPVTRTRRDPAMALLDESDDETKKPKPSDLVDSPFHNTSLDDCDILSSEKDQISQMGTEAGPTITAKRRLSEIINLSSEDESEIEPLDFLYEGLLDDYEEVTSEIQPIPEKDDLIPLCDTSVIAAEKSLGSPRGLSSPTDIRTLTNEDTLSMKNSRVNQNKDRNSNPGLSLILETPLGTLSSDPSNRRETTSPQKVQNDHRANVSEELPAKRFCSEREKMPLAGDRGPQECSSAMNLQFCTSQTPPKPESLTKNILETADRFLRADLCQMNFRDIFSEEDSFLQKLENTSSLSASDLTEIEENERRFKLKWLKIKHKIQIGKKYIEECESDLSNITAPLSEKFDHLKGIFLRNAVSSCDIPRNMPSRPKLSSSLQRIGPNSWKTHIRK